MAPDRLAAGCDGTQGRRKSCHLLPFTATPEGRSLCEKAQLPLAVAQGIRLGCGRGSTTACAAVKKSIKKPPIAAAERSGLRQNSPTQVLSLQSWLSPESGPAEAGTPASRGREGSTLPPLEPCRSRDPDFIPAHSPS
jgi:hypothetical protein